MTLTPCCSVLRLCSHPSCTGACSQQDFKALVTIWCADWDFLLHAASAKSFAQQRMFAAGRKRSSDMLLATPKQRLGRAALSAPRYRGPAEKFV